VCVCFSKKKKKMRSWEVKDTDWWAGKTRGGIMMETNQFNLIQLPVRIRIQTSSVTLYNMVHKISYTLVDMKYEQ